MTDPEYHRLMKKTIVGLLALSALSTASAANYVGGSVGVSTGGIGGLNLHYQTDRDATSAMRYSLDVGALNVGTSGISIGGSADYLMNIPNQTPSALVPYYGAGLGASVYLGGGAGFSLYPHGILGVKYNVTAPLSVFAEGSAGPAIFLGTGTGVNLGFGYGARIGINYMLNN